jgi:opacity protein-like surface antigen
MNHIPFGSRGIFAAVAAACLLLGGAAAAQEAGTDWYVGANVPLMFIDDTDTVTATTFGEGQQAVTLDSTVKTEHDTGFKIGGVFGRHFDSGLRIEGELFFARARVSKLTHTGISLSVLPQPLELEVPVPVSGSVDQLGAMANVWYDIDIGDAWTPYVGGGLGFIRVDQSDLSFDPDALKDGLAAGLGVLDGADQALAALQELGDVEVPTASATDTAFAWQLGAGVGYALSDTATLQLGYRLQAVDGLEFSGRNAMVSTMAETDLRVHFIEIGIRHRF